MGNKMKLIYDKPKGKRFNKYFTHIETENYWWSYKYKRWILNENKQFYDGNFSNYYNCKSVKAFKRHIKNHPELSGEVILFNKYDGYDVKVIIKDIWKNPFDGWSERESPPLLYINETRYNNGYDYNSTQSNESDSVFDYDAMMDAIANIPKNPLEEFANKHGFSIKEGDILIMPIEYENEFSNIHGIRFSSYITEPYLIKKPDNIYGLKGPKLNFGNTFMPLRKERKINTVCA